MTLECKKRDIKGFWIVPTFKSMEHNMYRQSKRFMIKHCNKEYKPSQLNSFAIIEMQTQLKSNKVETQYELNLITCTITLAESQGRLQLGRT